MAESQMKLEKKQETIKGAVMIRTIADLSNPQYADGTKGWLEMMISVTEGEL